ncbi:LPXTG cell wall anchor domain-containing protein [Clostridium baratii]|uniref:LPXTG cell wall anchor domain-containing protein n=1 Tax=Clostridium baratii TaxID=1561 RepID=UPI003BB01B36
MDIGAFEYQKTKEIVDKSELEKLYNDHKNDKQNNYTDESWKVFKNALNKAKDVLDNIDSTQEQVNLATKELKNAIENLIIKSENPNTNPGDSNSEQSSSNGDVSQNGGNLPNTGYENNILLGAISLIIIGIAVLRLKTRYRNE